MPRWIEREHFLAERHLRAVLFDQRTDVIAFRCERDRWQRPRDRVHRRKPGIVVVDRQRFVVADDCDDIVLCQPHDRCPPAKILEIGIGIID